MIRFPNPEFFAKHWTTCGELRQTYIQPFLLVVSCERILSGVVSFSFSQCRFFSQRLARSCAMIAL
jgi:hypothetical protein